MNENTQNKARFLKNVATLHPELQTDKNFVDLVKDQKLDAAIKYCEKKYNTQTAHKLQKNSKFHPPWGGKVTISDKGNNVNNLRKGKGYYFPKNSNLETKNSNLETEDLKPPEFNHETKRFVVNATTKIPLWLDQEARQGGGALLHPDCAWLRSNTTTVFTAKSGEGKTTYLHIMCRKLLECNHKLKIVYFAETFDYCGERQDLIMADSGGDARSRVSFVPISSVNSRQDFVDMVCSLTVSDFIKGTEGIVVIIDTTNKLLNAFGMNENEKEDVTEFASMMHDSMQHLAGDSRECSVIVTHHPRKERDGKKEVDPAGSTALKSQFNVRVALSADKASKVTTLNWEGQMLDESSCGYRMTDSKSMGDGYSTFCNWDMTAPVQDDNRFAITDKEAEKNAMALFAAASLHYSGAKLNTTTVHNMVGGHRETVKATLKRLKDQEMVDYKGDYKEIALTDIALSGISDAQGVCNVYCKRISREGIQFQLDGGRVYEGG